MIRLQILLSALAIMVSGCQGGLIPTPSGASDEAMSGSADGPGSDDQGDPPLDVGMAAGEDVAVPDDPLPKICRSGTSAWQPGVSAFTDVTAQSGLPELGVTGVRVSTADIDGDGLPDLSIRNHAVGERDDFAGGKRFTWLLRNKGGLAFEDITESSGFTTTRKGEQGRTTHIVIWGDVDNDGDMDAFSGTNWSDPAKDNGDRSEIMLNDGSGKFTLIDINPFADEPESAAFASASFTDVDKNGRLDLWIGADTLGQEIAEDRLYAGDGTGFFSDATSSYGLNLGPWTTLGPINSANVRRRSWGTTVCDVNNDGWPDLLSSSYGRYFNGLWQSQNGSYINRSLESAVGADHRADWSTNFNAQCYCQLMPEAADCADVPAPPTFFPCTSVDKLRWNHEYDREPFRLGGNTFSTICGDVDNDGDLDLMHLEIVHWDVGESSDPSELLLNDGAADPVFSRPGGGVTGLNRDWDRVDWNAGDMSGAFLDFDNDGRLDIYIGSSDYPGTRGFLFHQSASGTFEEVSIADGIDHPRSHGVAAADFDGDGDLDLVVGHGRFRCENDPTCYDTQEVHIFRNDIGAASNFVQLKLVGAQGTNKSAIGARVPVTAGGVSQTREVGGGYGHYGLQHGTVLHFGLGSACEIDSVEVRWPNAAGAVETFEGVQANYRVLLTEGGEVDYRADLL